MANKKIDTSGKRFGSLLVIEEFKSPYERPQERRKTIIKLKCQCDCGEISYPMKGNVLQGKTTCCPHCNNSKDLVGKKIGSLQIMKRIGLKWLCICECGTQEEVSPRFLRHAKNKSCDKCRHPKKYCNHPKLTREEALKITQEKKHILAMEKWIGKRLGKLKILSFSHWEEYRNRRRAIYNAKCKCGKLLKVRGDMQVKSCGCLHAESMLRGENQPRAILKNIDVKAIREYLSSKIGYSQREVAKIFGVSESLISQVAKNKTYKDI